MAYKGERWPEYQPEPLSRREKALLILGLSVATGVLAYRLASNQIIVQTTTRNRINVITSDTGR